MSARGGSANKNVHLSGRPASSFLGAGAGVAVSPTNGIGTAVPPATQPSTIPDTYPPERKEGERNGACHALRRVERIHDMTGRNDTGRDTSRDGGTATPPTLPAMDRRAAPQRYQHHQVAHTRVHGGV